MEEIDRNPNWENNTVIVYTSDQGYFLGEHGYYDKRFMYEEALRSPAVVRYPREIPAGSRVPAHVLLQNIDWAPTILDIVGVTPLSAALPLAQGRSARHLLTAGTGSPARQFGDGMCGVGIPRIGIISSLFSGL